FSAGRGCRPGPQDVRRPAGRRQGGRCWGREPGRQGYRRGQRVCRTPWAIPGMQDRVRHSAWTGREGHQRGVVPRLHPLTQTSLVLLPTLEGEGSKEFVMPDAAVNRSAQTTSPTVKKKPLATGDPAAQPNAN